MWGSKLANLAERNQLLIYDNYKVIIIDLLNYTFPLIPKLHGKMKQKLTLLWSRINTSPQLKNGFVKSKRLCQRIKHRFLVCLSFWRFQNRYKEMNVIRSLFYRYIACNFDRVANGNGGWQRLPMAVATERNWVERLSCKGSRT